MKLIFMNFTGLSLCGIATPIINRITNGQWAHVGMVTRAGIYFDAMPFAGVRNYTCKRMRLSGSPTVLDYATFPVQVPYEAAAEVFAYRQIGKPYDYGAIAGFTRRKWNDPAKWYCSELVAATLKAGGMDMGFVEDMRWVSPNDLARHFGVA